MKQTDESTEAMVDKQRRDLQKLRIAHIVKKFPALIEPKGSLLCSQQLSTGPHPEPDKFSPYPHTHPPTLF
jgi:hypothetical protein